MLVLWQHECSEKENSLLTFFLATGWWIRWALSLQTSNFCRWSSLLKNKGKLLLYPIDNSVGSQYSFYNIICLHPVYLSASLSSSLMKLSISFMSFKSDNSSLDQELCCENTKANMNDWQNIEVQRAGRFGAMLRVWRDIVREGKKGRQSGFDKAGNQI